MPQELPADWPSIFMVSVPELVPEKAFVSYAASSGTRKTNSESAQVVRNPVGRAALCLQVGPSKRLVVPVGVF